MVVLSMGDMLKRLGWTDGFHIPIANEANRSLEEEVMRLTMKRAKETAAHNLAKSKYDALEKHLKFLQQESQQNEALLNEFKRQIDVENHQYHLNKGHKEKMNQEIRQMSKEIADIGERQVLKKVDLKRSFEKMEILKSEASWDTEALMGWDETLRKRDEDNVLLTKFTEEDARRMEELEARRQAVCIEVVNRKKLIEKMVAECVNYEQVLDKTGKLFKKHNIEKQALVIRWQDSVHVLRQRDVDLRAVESQIDTAGMTLLNQKDLVEEQNIFLKNELVNNDVVEEETANLNQINSRTRRELNELVEYVYILNNDHGTVQRVLSSTGQQLEKERIRRKQHDLDSEQKECQIDALQQELVELKSKNNEVNSSSMSAAERVKRLESIIDHEKRLETNLEMDVVRVHAVLYRSQQMLRELHDNYRIIETEVHGCQLSGTLMRRRADIERTEKDKQEGVVYELQFRIDRLNSRLEHVEGVIKDSEGCELMQKRIAELEESFTKQKEIRTQLQNQVTRLSDEMRRLTCAISADGNAYQELQGKLVDNKLLHEGGLKTVQAAKQRAQQRQVAENIFRLRVSQLNKCISKEDNNIYNLQRLNIDLKAAMQARKLEIEAHRDIVFAQRNVIAEEISRLRMDIGGRGIRLEQFQSKHHIAIMSLGQGEDGEPISITYIKVKNSQQKYELVQKGDELDAKINKIESEIVALENTLKVVNMTNQKFRSSLTTIEENDTEAVEMRLFQKQIDEGILCLKQAKTVLISKQEEIYALQDTCNDLLNQRDHLICVFANLQDEGNKYDREETERAEKIHRASRQIKKLRSKIPIQLKTKYAKDLLIRHTQVVNKDALRKLMDFSGRYTDVAQCIASCIGDDPNLSLPKCRSRITRSDSSITSDSILTPGSSTSSCLSATDSVATNNVIIKFNENSLKVTRPIVQCKRK